MNHLPIDILLVIDRFNHSSFTDVRGQWHLNEDTMNSVVVVELLDLSQKFALTDSLGQLFHRNRDANLKCKH